MIEALNSNTKGALTQELLNFITISNMVLHIDLVIALVVIITTVVLR